MEEIDLPFAPPAPAPDPRVVAAKVAKEAERIAAAVDRRLAREQPDVPLPPRRQSSPVRPDPATAGTIELPFHSTIHDLARITGARHREMRQFNHRPLECVACGYRKLETRMPPPAVLEPQPGEFTPPQSELNVGPGEREYRLCTSCHDVNGIVPEPLFRRWSKSLSTEGTQRTYRQDPDFLEIADRLSVVESWRSRYRSKLDLADELPDVREMETLAFLAPAGRDEEGPAQEHASEFDGIELDERVPALSDFTAAVRAPDGYLLGTPDPEFARGAPYDPRVVGADEVEAWLLDLRWDESRKEFFRAAWERANEIEDEGLQAQRFAFIAHRWDPRTGAMVRDAEGARAPVTNKLAEQPAKVRTPSSRSVLHSGVDEGLDGEPGWKRQALARHEAAVAKFLAEVKPKLKARGLSAQEVEDLTTLPSLEPRRLPRRIGREITRLWGPVRERLDPGPRLVVDPRLFPAGVYDDRDHEAATTRFRYGDQIATWRQRLAALRRESTPLFLAPARELDRVVQEGVEARGAEAQRHEVAADVDRILRIEAGELAAEPARFLEMAGRARQREEFHANILAADADREKVLTWADEIHRANVSVRAATNSFAEEIRAAFRDPVAFQQAFKQLNEEEKRRALSMLRDSPATFGRDFATAFNRDFGSAGDLLGTGEGGREQGVVVAGRAFVVRPPSDHERAGVLAAGAGIRFLDAVGSRDVVRRHAALALELPPETPLKNVREACDARLRDALDRKAAAIRERDTLRAPNTEELIAAFGALHPRDRARMMKDDPGLAKLVPERRRELARPGLSL